MKRDTIKTLGGLIIIAGIVVATFMYGNSQRQAQLKHDQDVKKQQAAKTTATTTPSTTVTPKASVKATATTTATATPTASPKAVAVAGTPTPTNNTAPVKSPAASTLQGAGSSLGTSTGPAATPATGGNGSGLPDTGPGTMGLLGLAAIAVMLWLLRSSRRAMLAASRSTRL